MCLCTAAMCSVTPFSGQPLLFSKFIYFLSLKRVLLLDACAAGGRNSWMRGTHHSAHTACMRQYRGLTHRHAYCTAYRAEHNSKEGPGYMYVHNASGGTLWVHLWVQSPSGPASATPRWRGSAVLPVAVCMLNTWQPRHPTCMHTPYRRLMHPPTHAPHPRPPPTPSTATHHRATHTPSFDSQGTAPHTNA